MKTLPLIFHDLGNRRFQTQTRPLIESDKIFAIPVMFTILKYLHKDGVKN